MGMDKKAELWTISVSELLHGIKEEGKKLIELKLYVL